MARRVGPDHPVSAQGPREPSDDEPSADSDNAPAQRRRIDPAQAMAARLLLLIPLVVGVLLAEGIFAARGTAGDAVSLPGAVVAFLLLWQGVAWALRSWVAILLTFVPAVMITLGVAMVGEVEPVGGAALLILGATMMLAIVWSRVTAPHRRWTPGWLASAAEAGGDWSAADPGAGTGVAASFGTGFGPGIGSDFGTGPGFNAGTGFNAGRGADGAPDDGASVPSSAAASDAARTPGRAAPSWDTSGTDQRARDAFVAELCRRGGAAGPTVASLEDFFTGNGDPRSIAPGLRGAVPLNDFRIILHRLRSRGDVDEVSIQLEPLEEGAYAAGEWPLAGSVRVVGTLSIEDLDREIAPLHAEQLIGPLPLVESGARASTSQDLAEFAIWWE